MIFAKKCLKCGHEATLRENDLEALSQSERLLCAKEDLDFANMVKVTCTHCGTPSLVLRASLKVVDGGAVTQKLMALAKRATDLRNGAFKVQGPLFNAQRKQIIEAWLTNFAINLGDAISALTSGLDGGGDPISSPQVAEALDGMCEEYGKGLQRLEDVTSSNVRKDFQALMTSVRSAISPLRTPQSSASTADALSPKSSLGGVAVATSGASPNGSSNLPSSRIETPNGASADASAIATAFRRYFEEFGAAKVWRVSHEEAVPDEARKLLPALEPGERPIALARTYDFWSWKPVVLVTDRGVCWRDANGASRVGFNEIARHGIRASQVQMFETTISVGARLITLPRIDAAAILLLSLLEYSLGPKDPSLSAETIKRIVQKNSGERAWQHIVGQGGGVLIVILALVGVIGSFIYNPRMLALIGIWVGMLSTAGTFRGNPLYYIASVFAAAALTWAALPWVLKGF